jgi:prepilin-type N-terminal cleavage/methylation domain-containing protein
MSPAATIQSQAAFTLIEIIVAMGLLSILVLGTVGMLANVEDQFFRLTLRQKAIFVLHGEVERLAFLYRDYDKGPDFSTITVQADKDFTDDGEEIFREVGTAFPVSNLLTDHSNSVTEWLNFNDIEKTATILVDPRTTAIDSNNWVWLDRGHNDVDIVDPLGEKKSRRRILAKLWWEVEDATTLCDSVPPAAPPLPVLTCIKLTVSLNYPYIYEPTGNLLKMDMPGLDGWQDTIKISTFVAKKP